MAVSLSQHKGMAPKSAARARRQIRVRKKVFGAPQRPRLVVSRSARHISAQVIDDRAGRTLAAATSLEPDLRGVAGSKSDDAATVGRLLAERAKAAGVKQVVFDRAGYRYHGRIKSLADAARAAGLEF